jgi:tetratricopeptide (TPR) repeat protein
MADMPEQQDTPHRPDASNIEVAPSATRRLRGFGLWLLVFLFALLIFFLSENTLSGVRILILIITPLFLVLVLFLWLLVAQTGFFTWMRLAWAPAKAMASGDRDKAERAFSRALERARRFEAHDRRRGMMLIELAGYAKNQGRYAEARDLFEEAVEILGRDWRQRATEYFVALNNYAIYFIHMGDYSAAQEILEKALDLSLLRKKGQGNQLSLGLAGMQQVELVLHCNLMFLFLEMNELAEARHQLDAAGSLIAAMNRHSRARFDDHYRTLRALVLFHEKDYAASQRELDQCRHTEYPPYLRLRAKLHQVEGAHAQAEELLLRYFAEESKRGSCHRPELRESRLELAESQHALGKHDEAFQALEAARSLTADFALPRRATYRRALEVWLRRARELNRHDIAASIDADLQQPAAVPEQAITISPKLRTHTP